MEFDLGLFTIPLDNPLTLFWWFFVHGGFILVFYPFIKETLHYYLHTKQHEYEHHLNYVLLAIDVPKDSEQSPKAVENIFAAVSATYTKLKWHEKWLDGKTQPTFSFEIVSLGGYVQFLIRTETDFRDLVEAAVYAQYPNAEITAVEDYVNRISGDFDTAAYDLWGTELVLAKPYPYPIRTYEHFEHQLSKEFKDPMAALLEILGRINPDEDVWLQVVVIPGDEHWKHESQHLLKELVEGAHNIEGFFDYIVFKFPMQVLDFIGEAIYPLWGHVEEEHDKKAPSLTSGQKKVVEAVEQKMSKIAYHVKFRMIYWGRRETFTKGRGVAAVLGAFQQFNALDLNGFVPAGPVTTKANYFLKESRINHKQRSILRAYKTRSAHAGMGHGIVLNIEELATIYHFPIMTVKAPLVKKTEVKKAEPPFTLPIFGSGYLRSVDQATEEHSEAESEADDITILTRPTSSGRTERAPTNLPFAD